MKLENHQSSRTAQCVEQCVCGRRGQRTHRATRQPNP